MQKKKMMNFTCGNIKSKTILYMGKKLVIPADIKSDSMLSLQQKKIKSLIKTNQGLINELRYKEKMLLDEKIKELDIRSLQLKDIIEESKIEETKFQEEEKGSLMELVNKIKVERGQKSENPLDLIEKEVKMLKDENACLLEKLEDNQRLDLEFNEFIKKFNPTKIVHGFSALLINKDEILMAYHTSGEESPVWGIRDKNIEVNESLNPIKYINKPFILNKEDFVKYFTISNPEKMLTSPRYGSNLREDMAHCSLRALAKTIKTSNSVISVSFDKTSGEELIRINQNTNFNINEEGVIKTPAAVVISEKSIGFEDLIEKLDNDIRLLDGDSGRRQDLLKIIEENYRNFIEKR